MDDASSYQRYRHEPALLSPCPHLTVRISKSDTAPATDSSRGARPRRSRSSTERYLRCWMSRRQHHREDGRSDVPPVTSTVQKEVNKLTAILDPLLLFFGTTGPFPQLPHTTQFKKKKLLYLGCQFPTQPNAQ